MFRQIAALSLLVAVAGCASQTATQNTIPVGVYGPLTGSKATFGTSMKNGIEMRLDQVNRAGGVLGKQVVAIAEDDQGTPKGAQASVQKLVARDRVVALLGEVASSLSIAGGRVAQTAKIPMISPASTNPKVTQIGDYVFRTCFTDDFQGAVAAKFAANNLKHARAAILRDIRNDYSVGLADSFKATFTRLGGRIVADESYSEGARDFAAPLTTIRQANPQCIFVPGYYTEVGLIGRQARQLGIKAPLLGGDGWDSPVLLDSAAQDMEGCYYSSHYSVDDPSPRVQEFVKEYRRRYGQVPDAMAALGYDAAGVLADALKRAGSTDPKALRDAIASTSNFAGVTGEITIGPDRNARKPAVVLQIKGGKLQLVETVRPG